MSTRPTSFALGLALLAVGCTAIGPAGTGTRPRTAASPTPVATTVAASVSPSTPTPASPSPSPTVRQDFYGRVLDVDGSPLAGAAVHAALAVTATADPAASSQVLAAADGLDARTDADGYFTLQPPAGSRLNIEAVKSEDFKALQQDVPADARKLVFHIARTGSITGRVAATGVEDLLGVDVYIAGTSYTAKTDAGGNFTLAKVPAGTFTLTAGKTGLGTAHVDGVEVSSAQVAEAPALAIVRHQPKIAGIVPTNGGEGTTVVVTGSDFGASTGALLQASFNGVPAIAPRRIDDQTLRIDVPHGATSGNLVVTVDGLAANPMAFQVLATLALSPRPVRLVTGATQAFTLTATDTSGQAVTAPAVTWAVTGGSTLDHGTLTAGPAGTTRLTVSSGLLTDTLAIQVASHLPTVSTLAGAEQGTADGALAQARFSEPIAVAYGAHGDLYVADNLTSRVRHITPDGQVSTLAGGPPGYADGTGAAASFANPNGIAIDAAGNLYVTEWEGCRIRRITPQGAVTTLAGSPNWPDNHHGFNDGTGTAAFFDNPKGIAIDAAGNLFVADFSNNRIRKIDLTNPAAPVVSTYAGDGTKADVDGPRASAEFANPAGVAVAADGTVYVSDNGTSTIRRIAPDGTVTAIAGTGTAGNADGAGAKAQFNGPTGLALAPDGNLYVVDSGNHCVREVDLAGADHAVSTLAGAGTRGFADGIAYQARFAEPHAVAVDPLDPAHGLAVADRLNNRIRKIQL